MRSRALQLVRVVEVRAMIAQTFGVDTVGLAFPITDVELRGATATVSNFGTDEEAVTYRRKLDGGGFLATGFAGTCWVEASLPKRIGQWQALHPDALGDVLGDLMSEASRWVEPARVQVHGIKGNGPVTWRSAKVVRVDVVRDFHDVRGFGTLLDGLAAIRQPGRAKVRRYRDSDANAAETLRVGPRSTWAATLYDKHAETQGVAPAGSVRYEARLRHRFLTSKAAERVVGSRKVVGATITPELVEGLARERWSHVGFGRSVNGTGSFVDRINAADLSPRVKRDLTAYLCARALGIDLQWHRNTVGKYRRLAASLGIVVTAEDLAETFAARLDLDTGTESVEQA